MILVFGGTTEGKQVAAILDALQTPYYYSNKTNVPFSGSGIAIHGALTKEQLEIFCKEKSIQCIINASHPFATLLHDTIASIALEIPIIRFEREFTERSSHALVTYVDSFKTALQEFEKNDYKSLLALSGVQTIEKLTSYWKQHTTWFRILDRDSSREIAKKANFPSEQLLYGYPQNKAEEIEIYSQLHPAVIFTKESGIHGKLEQKIAAAIATNTPIIILTKPLVANRYLCMNSIQELTTFF
ncbi:precorrin-6A/cobalt-precorrin-6A reductase [Kordia sp.]|uniref:precorrin-6A/cobalt-precorrin-6A reductase n=1 Tax=Kordia sp. TaxID=1965332 RepID=UPI0025C1430A|nr:precorrin-6A/cobalt-precorrin-6A reductase [Kordia sp.]MCH2194810.1 precorrin-6A/cobalt-precorrin-6A reductase [Kordia sp.]